jgi:hypothetical protein
MMRRREKDGQLMFGPFLNSALISTLVPLFNNNLSIKTSRPYSKMVAVRILKVVIRLLTTGMMGVVRPGHICAIALVFGVDWCKNVCVIKSAWNSGRMHLLRLPGWSIVWIYT